jgi:hypothetical protein
MASRLCACATRFSSTGSCAAVAYRAVPGRVQTLRPATSRRRHVGSGGYCGAFRTTTSSARPEMASSASPVSSSSAAATLCRVSGGITSASCLSMS